MAWQFLLTDLYGNVHGEVTKASDRRVSLPHMRVPTASFTISLWDPLADPLVNSECLLRCYRIDDRTGQRNLAFHGPVIGVDENAEGMTQTIAVSAAGPFWRLTKRIIPASKTKAGFSAGSEAGQWDLGHIAQAILNDVNGVDFTGITNGQFAGSINGWVAKWYLKNAAEGIAELAAGFGSFEHRVRPLEPTVFANARNWPKIGELDLMPTLGQTRPDAIFEYGTPRANVASYRRSSSWDTLVNNALVSVGGWPDGVEKVPNTGDPGIDKYALVETGDATSMNRFGVMEDVVSDAGILDDNLRLQLGQHHLSVRARPRQQITFKPATGAKPAPFVDYEVGDTVRARAVVGGSVRFDALFRIWGVNFTLDQNGNEDVELELVIP